MMLRALVTSLLAAVALGGEDASLRGRAAAMDLGFVGQGYHGKVSDPVLGFEQLLLVVNFLPQGGMNFLGFDVIEGEDFAECLDVPYAFDDMVIIFPEATGDEEPCLDRGLATVGLTLLDLDYVEAGDYFLARFDGPDGTIMHAELVVGVPEEFESAASLVEMLGVGTNSKPRFHGAEYHGRIDDPALGYDHFLFGASFLKPDKVDFWGLDTQREFLSECSDEAYSFDGDALVVPSADVPGSCIGDTLAMLELSLEEVRYIADENRFHVSLTGPDGVHLEAILETSTMDGRSH